MKRRHFFKSVIQGSIFSALAGTSGYLMMRDRSETEGACNFDFVCGNCKKNPYCRLPEASDFRLKKRLFS